jgi:hypothetical protein
VERPRHRHGRCRRRAPRSPRRRCCGRPKPIDCFSGSYPERLRGSVGWRTTVRG